MAVTLSGTVVSCTLLTVPLPRHVAARSGNTEKLVLRIEMRTDAGQHWQFDTPEYRGTANDWFDAVNQPKIAAGQQLTVRGTPVGCRTLNRVRRIYTDANMTAAPQTVTVSVPIDNTADAVDAYKDAMQRGDWKAALNLADTAHTAIAKQYAMLAAWSAILEDDLAYIRRRQTEQR